MTQVSPAEDANDFHSPCPIASRADVDDAAAVTDPGAVPGHDAGSVFCA